MELEAFKNSVTSAPSKSVKDVKGLEELVKAMASLKLKDKEIEKIKVNLVQKDTKITSLKGVVTQKYQQAKEAINSKNQIKENISKYIKKLVGKTILKEARYASGNQLFIGNHKIHNLYSSCTGGNKCKSSKF